MAHAGQTISNPATGEKITFVRTAADTGGELLVLDTVWTKQGERTPEHVHPEMEERFEVVEGRATLRIAGRERTLGPGEAVAVAPGTPHIGWNPDEEEARLRLEFRPALRWEDLVERLFALAREGRTDERGTPDRETMIALMREFHREIAPA